ncbi:tRNA threonylcarbamoyladenosine dehydratase [Halochromatium roseum]|uniref:tRNA threonylcarbamoyladenosine dehydratase n=1 Tax=Halochromatium roseum TaxID=391920 RepID=UPI001914D396|nr:tRNA threonylcarbamoyladenosine dehydratase [Halochromatium roseum]MBK5942065.1 tRNA threonylcarbamoyladenosine dehydratase [Halochromatium roseum]
MSEDETLATTGAPAGLSERTRILIGDQGVERLRAARVLVAGLGGVGSYAAEALARAGVGELILADCDTVAASNINRQLCALHSTLGAHKTEVMHGRILDINPLCKVTLMQAFLAADELPSLIADGGYDQVVDAIDSLSSKLALLGAALDSSTSVVSSMGAGGRLDPARIRIGDLMDSNGCPLARKLRQQLRRRGYGRGIAAVWSDEPPRPPLAPEPMSRGRARAVNGTISYLPGLFGLTLAGLCVQRLVQVEEPG